MTSSILPSHVSFINNTNFQKLSELFKPSIEDKKFTLILSALFSLYFIIAVIVPFIEQTILPREIKEQVPVKLAKVILQKKQLPPPVKKSEKVKKEKEIENIKQDLPKKKTQVKENAKKRLSTEQKRKLARKKAQASGLAVMKDQLFEMREDFKNLPSTKLTSSEKHSSEFKLKRKVLSAELKMQGAELTVIKALAVEKNDELNSHGIQRLALSAKEAAENTDVLVEETIAVNNSGQRSEMSLRRTLESHKARLYSRYNRALRKDPFLQGKVLFEIEIQPNGKISSVSVKSSELNNDKLERQLIIILRSITFPTEKVNTIKTIWAIDFLPN